MDENKDWINIECGERPFFAIDNSDFENDTPDGKGKFHGTGKIANQNLKENAKVPLHFERLKSGDPKTNFKDDHFSKVYQCKPPSFLSS